MGNKPENITAFPVPLGSYDSGMTLRDYFAGAALHGLLARQWEAKGRELLGVWAINAYMLADEMLKAREPKQTPSTEA